MLQSPAKKFKAMSDSAPAFASASASGSAPAFSTEPDSCTDLCKKETSNPEAKSIKKLPKKFQICLNGKPTDLFLTEKEVRLNKTLETMIGENDDSDCESEEETVPDESEKEKIFPLPLIGDKWNGCTLQTLKRVVEFSEFYCSPKNKKGIHLPRPLPHSDIKKFMDDWFFDFISVKKADSDETDFSKVFELVSAANTLDNTPLIDLCCAKLASHIKNQSTEEIRKKFGIQNDFTKEEEEKLRRENPWLFAQDIDEEELKG